MSVESIELLDRFLDWLYKGMNGLSSQEKAFIINEFYDYEEK